MIYLQVIQAPLALRAYAGQSLSCTFMVLLRKSIPLSPLKKCRLPHC